MWTVVRPGMDAHPVEPGALGEYAFVLQERGSAAAEQRFPEVAAHVRSGCDRCAADLRDFPFELERQPSPFEGLHRRLATLISSPMVGQLAPSRGSGEPAAKTYRAGPVSISLSVSAGGEAAFSIEGLVVTASGATPGQFAGAEASLGAPGAATATAMVDGPGNFSFDGIRPGVYVLELRLSELVVVVEELLVGAPGADH